MHIHSERMAQWRKLGSNWDLCHQPSSWESQGEDSAKSLPRFVITTGSSRGTELDSSKNGVFQPDPSVLPLARVRPIRDHHRLADDPGYCSVLGHHLRVTSKGSD